MANNTWDNVLDPHPIARSAAKNTFTTYQDVAGSTTNPLPETGPFELKIGTRFEIEARGEFSGSGTPTVQVGAIYGATPGAAGGVALAQSGVITPVTGAAAWPWHYNISGIVTAAGSAGTLYCQGILDLGTALTTMASSWCPITAAARAVTGIDTTLLKMWGLGWAFGTSSVSNQVIVDVFTVHILNQGKT